MEPLWGASSRKGERRAWHRPQVSSWASDARGTDRYGFRVSGSTSHSPPSSSRRRTVSPRVSAMLSA